MTSLILRTATRYLAPLMLVFAVYLLVRGHDHPGGGFIGGLVAATAFALSAIADGPDAVRRVMRVEPRALAVAGVALALAAGVAGLLAGEHFLGALWTTLFGWHTGTPFLFDVGVMMTVVGAVTTVLLSMEDERRDHARREERGED